MLDEKYKAALIADLCALVRQPSRSFPTGGEEGDLQRWMAARMRATGARVRSFEPDDLPEFRRHPLCCGPDRNYRDRPTVIGEIGPEGAPALLIAAHSDTVPITEFDAWSFSPFLGEVRDGHVCGLGSSDDKWGTATMLTLMRALMESGQPLRKRLIFASTIDEENGVGNGLLLLVLAGIKAEAGLYLDGGGMDVLIGNSGGSNLYLRPKRPADEAVLRRQAERLESACAELSSRRAPLFSRPYFENSSVRDKSVKFVQRTDGRGPFFLLAFYTVPGEENTAVRRQLEDAVAGALGADAAQYDLSYRQPWFEPALIASDAPIVGIMSDSILAIRGAAPRVTVVSKQDVFVLHNHAHIPTVSFGVTKWDGPRTFHQPDEQLSVEDAWTGARIAFEAVRRWLED